MTEHPSFELERFAWTRPDRLDVSGTFWNLDGSQAGPPSLVVRTENGERRLPAVAESVSGPPAHGQRWSSAFAWQEAPAPFETARLELGDDLLVELPLPGTKRLLRRQRFEVRRRGGDAGRRVDAAPTEGTSGTPAQLGLQAQLIAAEERAREAQLHAEQARTELARALKDLEAEREGRQADAERFRQVLEAYRASAEEALAAQQDAAAQLGSDLREAHEALAAKDAAIARLREEVAGTEGVRAELEQARRHAETVGAEADGLRTELTDVRGQAEAARSELDVARGALQEAHSDAERLVARLAAVAGGDRSASE